MIGETALIAIGVILIILLLMIYTGVGHNHKHLIDIENHLGIGDEKVNFWKGDSE